ncbi:MAG: DUF4339 domain-containing protein, partial [Thermoguttaceae bacterium]|nr:DUF4339 domain-containing protein [Thermoguttaceae bacterium]
MNDLYYVRIRGSVVGPFRPEQVRQLVERGKISRLHELSTDRQTWHSVREFPELAVAFATTPGADGPSSPSSDDVAGQSLDGSHPPPVSRQQWYYDEGGQSSGPVDEAGIAALVASGTITPNTLVWTTGMETWEPLQQTALAARISLAVPSPRPSSASISSAQGEPGAFLRVVDAATSSIPWARATCLISGILFGVFALIDFFSILAGPSALARLFSFFSLVFFLGYIWSCTVWFRYTSFLAKLR